MRTRTEIWASALLKLSAMRCCAVLLGLMSVALITRPAGAGDQGRCPGADIVETSLQNGTSSGYYIPGLKLIILNQTILAQYGATVQQFILAHECAHADAAVGEDENKADCAAAKRGVKDGWLKGKQDIIKICVHLSRFPADATHPPVGFRCKTIQRCAAEATQEIAQSRRQWPETEVARSPLEARKLE